MPAVDLPQAGAIHPRTLLADLAGRRGARRRRPSSTELAWREFYADVLWHQPDPAWHDLRPELGADGLRRPDGRLVEAWREGRTGYPIVDAGMRQLLAEGWMHNRVRMITASFLTKDLHVWWPVGARHFLDHLVDGDIASNNHGWQWVAGTGTDASPYFRVFNPVPRAAVRPATATTCGAGCPSCAHLAGAAVHEPWKHADGYANGYPERIVDHAEERKETLARYEAANGSDDRPAQTGARCEHGPIAELRAFINAALIQRVEREHWDPPAVYRRRQVVVVITFLVGTGVLAWALRITPGDPRFYLATVALGLVWLVGALVSGPLHAGMGHTPTGRPGVATHRPVARPRPDAARRLPARARLVARIPVLREPVQQLLDHARFGSFALVLAITFFNGVVEELYFRGALYAALPRHQVLVTTVLYALTTVGSGIPLLVLAAAVIGLVTALQRRVTGGFLGPMITH